MNELHLRMLASPEWAQTLEREVLPWAESVADLGDHVLEVGPGPGLTTDLLRTRTDRLTAVEIDPALATKLAARLAGSNVEVIEASAAETGLPDDTFSAAACFSMLHHVPSPQLQDAVFHELFRVLRPGAPLVAIDAIDEEGTRESHIDDVFVPLDPRTLPARLAAAGFADIAVDREGFRLRFHARKPA